jgi:Patatin phospholipase
LRKVTISFDHDPILFSAANPADEVFGRHTWEYIDNYRKLVEEVMASLDPKTADQISKRPRYIETVGEACPLSVTRITREPVEGESASRDYEFSRKSIDQHIADGYALTKKTLNAPGHSSM